MSTSSSSAKPDRIINGIAPIRICDLGGWTDTWFAGHGTIFNIGVYPYVEVQVAVFLHHVREHQITLHAENYGERYVASTGTSAAVTVALIGALDALTPGRMTPHEIAYAAHRVETQRLGLQSGIQDQLCSAYGGINFIEMFHYPYATVSQMRIPDTIWWELERRLALIFLGRTHSSSAVHEQVIAALEREGDASPRLEALRRCAICARDALYAGDFVALGRAMIDNTEAQRALHPALVNADADAVIALAREHGVLGWKVNGAGGEGGSLTLLCGPDASANRALLRDIRRLSPLFQPIPIYLSRMGLRVWTTDGER
jgi:D-glycero-alpha-D-manno-heptose-7-phosphate kinase